MNKSRRAPRAVNFQSGLSQSAVMQTMVTSAKDERFTCETGVARRVAEIVEPALDDLGFRLVRVRLSGQDGTTLQIMAEREDGTISVDDCETISRQISPMLDVHDPIAGTYRLEISSPGIDRPLVRPSDFENWKGHVARVEMRETISGRKRFRGAIEGYENGEALILCDLGEMGEQVIGLPLELVQEARLVLTDELVREALNRSKHKN